MGNELTVQGIIENIDQYKPDIGLFELLDEGGFQADKVTNMWQHKFTSQRLIEKQYIAKTWPEFIDILQSFSFRYNNNFVIASKYLTVQNSQSIKKLTNHNNFPQTSISIFYEAAIINLSHFKEIPQQDGAYFLIQSLKGFDMLVKRLKFPFQVKEQMFHITSNRESKVWVSNNVTSLNTINGLRPLLLQSNMIRQILQIIKSNIFFTTATTQSSRKTSSGQNCFMLGVVIQQLFNENPQSFQKAIELAEMYFGKYNIKVGCFMNCLKDFTNEELIALMKQNRVTASPPRYAVSTDQYSRVINNNSSLISLQPFTPPPSNVFSNQSSGSQIHRNHSMGNLNHYQSQSRLFEEKAPSSVKNSRSKSKRSGLSLVKNQQQSHQSLSGVKEQRPSTSIVHDRKSVLKIQSQHQKMMPPRASSAKKVYFVTTQRKQIIPPFGQNSSKLQLSNHHNKGISITRKQESKQKENMRQSSPQSHFNRTNNHCITQLSNTISVGTLPTPKYQNDSKGKTVVIVNNNKPVNFATISPSQMYHPNQSLTRFQKENIIHTNPPSLNASVNNFYEVPRIYVHSPKAQGKILRLDSMSTQQESRQKQIHYRPNSNHSQAINQQQTHRKEPQQQQNTSQLFYYPSTIDQHRRVTFELPKQQKNKINHTTQFNNYIDSNKQLFTHPILYEYITNNNNKTDILPRQESKGTTKRTQEKQLSYIDYLNSVHISESLDYNTTEKILSLVGSGKDPVKRDQTISSNKFTLNDFPTIEEIDEPPHTYEVHQREDSKSFLPAQLNLKSNMNIGSKNQLSSVRRGYEESLVFEYKKFDDDTYRSNQTPRRYQPSQFKKMAAIEHHNDSNITKKYNTAQTWQPTPPIPVKSQAPANYKTLFPANESKRPPIVIAQKPIEQQPRRSSQSPLSKMIYNGAKQPAINPLLLQDMQRIRQNRVC